MWRKMTLGVIVATVLSMVPTIMAAPAQNGSGTHRILFDMAGQAPAEWDLLLEQIASVQQSFGAKNTQIEVVVRDQALGWLLAENTAVQDRLRRAAENGVVFVVGEDALQRRNLTKGQLLPFVRVVDSAVAELVRQQNAGWAYVRSGP